MLNDTAASEPASQVLARILRGSFVVKSLVPVLCFYIDCKCNIRHPEAILLHLCKVSIRYFCIVVLAILPHLLIEASLWQSLAAPKAFKSIFGTIFALENLHRTLLGTKRRNQNMSRPYK